MFKRTKGLVLVAALVIVVLEGMGYSQAPVYQLSPSTGQNDQSLAAIVQNGDSLLLTKYRYLPDNPQHGLDPLRVNPGGDTSSLTIGQGSGALAIYSAKDCVTVTFQFGWRGKKVNASTDDGFPLFRFDSPDSGHLSGDVTATLVPNTKAACYVVFRYYHSKAGS